MRPSGAGLGNMSGPKWNMSGGNLSGGKLSGGKLSASHYGFGRGLIWHREGYYVENHLKIAEFIKTLFPLVADSWPENLFSMVLRICVKNKK